MESYFFPFQSSLIHYLKAGKGRQLLICFHGYGESADSFAFLEEYLSEDYTLLAIDLPFHGQTQWKDRLVFGPDDLLEVLRAIVPEYMQGERKLALLGFSMGGRIALAMTEKIPEKVEAMLLLAPDGLRINPWYWLATQSRPGNLLFQQTMKKPGFFFAFARAGKNMGLVNPSVYKFFSHSLMEPELRKMVYLRWTCLSRFRPHLGRLKKEIVSHKIKLDLVYGEFDRVIRPERGILFSQGIEEHCRVRSLPTGHQLLLPKNKDIILDWLNHL